MFKKLMAVSVIAAMPAIAMAGAPTISGYADVTFTANEGTAEKREFGATGEINISNKLSDQVSVRVDIDLALSAAASGNMEQAYFAYSPIKPLTVIGGVFNNPIGWEKEDAPDMYQINKGQIYKILDHQTALPGNNIAGIALAGAVGPATITLAALNDIGHNDLEKNSFAAVVNASPVKGLDLEVGYVTQDDVATTAENVWDVNATYAAAGATIGVEVLGAGNLVDLAIGGTINYAVNPMFNATVRYDTVSYKGDFSGKDDTTSFAIAGTFNAAKNLAILAEFTKYDGSLLTTAEDKVVTLEFIALF